MAHICGNLQHLISWLLQNSSHSFHTLFVWSLIIILLANCNSYDILCDVSIDFLIKRSNTWMWHRSWTIFTFSMFLNTTLDWIDSTTSSGYAYDKSFLAFGQINFFKSSSKKFLAIWWFGQIENFWPNFWPKIRQKHIFWSNNLAKYLTKSLTKWKVL